MQCLRCSNEAIPGKALCASCFAAHQKNIEFEETDEWVNQQLESTRSESRGRQREAKGPQTSLHSLTLTLAPALLALGGLIMLSVWVVNNVSFTFTPNPEPEQNQGGPSASVGKGPGQPHPGSPTSPKLAAPAAQPPQQNNGMQTSLGSPTPAPQPTATQQATATPVYTGTPTSTPTVTPTTTALSARLVQSLP